MDQMSTFSSRHKDIGAQLQAQSLKDHPAIAVCIEEALGSHRAMVPGKSGINAGAIGPFGVLLDTQLL